ncbi:M48 family metallopeptidase [Fusobacterium sp. MFO224]|uniref:M48 family metallopeptidase n=1 Tax=Fusobacterium sp. MFO224 TaxID=3378070 RepID=UPI003854CB7D
MKPKIIITRKNIKNLILKIKGDGNIYISSPIFLSDEHIYNFISKKERWIEKKLKETTKKSRFSSPSYSNNCEIFYLGNSYFLNLKLCTKCNTYISNNSIVIETPKPDDTSLTKEIINSWYRKQGKILFEKLLIKYLEITNKKINKFNVKTLKSNWGSCNYNKKIINLNSELMKKDIRFIEYVILHEIAHLVHPNHSKAFYSYIENFMPDWKERKSL